MKSSIYIATLCLASTMAVAGTNGWTLLHTAADTGDKTAATRLLRSQPALINARDDGGHTPLHLAVFSGRLEMVVFLLAQGAALDAADVCGWTPLHTAATRNQKEIAQLLLDGGAAINTKDRRNQTPLRLAIKYERPDFAEFLRQHGAKE